MCEIYVACLAAYNAGKLHGVWLDATEEVDDIRKSISDMLAESPVYNDGEFEIHDSEDAYGYRLIQAGMDIEQAHEIAVFLEEHGELGAALLADDVSDIEEATNLLEEHYEGEFNSLNDFCHSYVEERYGQLPEFVNSFVDYNMMWQDLSQTYFEVRIRDSIHIFSYA